MTGGNTARRAPIPDGKKAAERRSRNRATKRIDGRRRITGLHPSQVILDEAVQMAEFVDDAK